MKHNINKPETLKVMKYYLSFICLFLVIISCSKQEPRKVELKTYEKDNLSFTLPNGWKVNQDYDNKEQRFLELNKYANYKVESTMGIGIFHEAQIADSVLSNQIKDLKYAYQKVNLKILEKNKKGKIGDFDITYTTYEGDDNQNKIYGKVGVIQDNDKTITVQIVESKADISESDYNTLFKSFSLK